MSLALVSFNQPAAQCLVELINQNNSQMFTVDQLAFSNPTIGITPTDTNVVVTPSAASGLTGNVTLEYHRRDLNVFFEGAMPSLYIQGTVTVQGVLDALLNQFQIYGTAGPNDGFTVTFNSDASQATITPNPNHFVWVGTLTANIDQRPLLSGLIASVALPGFAQPANQTPTCPLALANYGLVNGNQFSNQLLLLQSGYNFSQYLATWDIGTGLLGEAWYAAAAPGDFNVFGSTVLYNGPAVGPFTLPGSSGAYNGYVLILNLGPACTNRCGQLYIAYQAVTSSGGSAPSPPPFLPPVSDLLYN